MRLFFIIILFIETSVLADIKKINVGITISGGVSLGAYEAGFSYYLTETLKANQTTEFRPSTTPELQQVELIHFYLLSKVVVMKKLT